MISITDCTQSSLTLPNDKTASQPSSLALPNGKATIKPSKTFSFTTEDTSAKLHANFHSQNVQDLLLKWGMRGGMYMKRFYYDQVFQEQYDNLDSFLEQFFCSPNVNPCIKVLCIYPIF